MKRGRYTWTAKTPPVQLAYRLAVVYGLYFVMRVLFILFNPKLFSFDSVGEVLTIFGGALRFDTAAIIYTNLPVILLMMLPLHLRYRRGYQHVVSGFYYLFNSVAIILNMGDVIYYRFTLRRTTFSVFSEFSNEQNLFGLFGQFLLDYWYITLLGILLIGLLVVCDRRVKASRKPYSRNPIIYYGGGSLLLAGAIALCIGGIRGDFAHSTRPMTLNNASLFVKTPHHTPLVLNTPFAIIRTIGKKTFSYQNYFSQEEAEKHFNPLQRNAVNPYTGKAKGYNVMLIIMESLGTEVVGALNTHIPNYKGYTPFLDSLAQRSLVFSRCYANGRKSIDALPACLASIPSMGTPFILTPYSYNRINTLASVLDSIGYETTFCHGAPNGSMGFDAFASQAGFKNYRGKTEYNNDAHYDGIWGIWDEHFLQYVVRETTRQKEPFFTTVFTLSSHHPFKVPEEYTGRFPEGEVELHRVIGYADYAIKRFFDEAEKQPWFKNTLFVIVGDHVSQNVYPEYNTPSGVFATPLFLYAPGIPRMKGINDSIVAQQCDIMPTVLDLLGYREDYVAFGSSLFNPQALHFALMYKEVQQLIEGDYLLEFNEGKAIGLYNYRTDALFTKNLLGTGISEQAVLENRLKSIIQQHNARMIENRLTVVPPPSTQTH